MLRIHFTTEDLARVRVAAGPEPLWEILLSLHMLQQRDGALVFGHWRQQQRGLDRRLTEPLIELAPPRGYSPDFLTPTGHQSLTTGVEAVLGAGRTRLRHDLAELAAERRPTPWTRTLAGGGTPALRRLGAALHAYHAHALAPYWPRIRASVTADRDARARSLFDHGPGGMLAGLHPRMRWQTPVLTTPCGGEDRDFYLDGRGLLLVPSFFCWRDPICLKDPSLPPVLVYPIARPLGWAVERPAEAGSDRSLAALLGTTRAAALHAIADGCTTSQLAAQLRVSPATASAHATTLRDAGLTRTHRRHRSAHHTLTPLGAQLLDGQGCHLLA